MLASILCFTAGICAYACAEQTPEIEKQSFPTSEWIQRADLYFWRSTPAPKGWLLLCPGRNGNGETLLKEVGWREFARRNQLWICGVSFMSNRKDDLLGRYTQVAQGSGQCVLDACDSRAGKPLPLVIVGFSAGARFTTDMVAWKPERFAAWSAQAVGRWPPPLKDGREAPPGIVASGEYDAGSWFPSLQYFQAARKAGHNVIWLSLEKLGHRRSPALDEFTRDFFEWVLLGRQDLAEWRDIDSKKTLSVEDSKRDPIFACWLPSEKLASRWSILHTP